MGVSGKTTARAAEVDRCQQLTPGGMFESWQARLNSTGEHVFFKQSRSKRGQQFQEARKLLTNLREIYQRLRHPAVLHPLEIDIESGASAIYPYLSPPEWQPLTPESFCAAAETLLPQICAVVDFIHSQGVVHRDLKPEHFMVSTGSRPYVYLIDFDFAKLAGTRSDKQVDDSRSDKRIVGTPGFMPPEAFHDHLVLPQGDHCSLGKMLLYLISENRSRMRSTPEALLREDMAGTKIDVEKIPPAFRHIGKLAAQLVKQDPFERPSYLGAELAAALDYTPEQRAAYDKRLIWQALLSWHHYRSQNGLGVDLVETVQRGVKLIGVPEEILRDARQAIRKSPLAVTRSLKRLLDCAVQERLGEFWRLQLSEDSLRRFYQAGWVQKHVVALPETNHDSDWHEVREFGRAAIARGDLLKALTIQRSLVDSLEQDPSLEPANLAQLNRELAVLYKSLGYVELADHYFERCLAEAAMTPAERVQALLELADTNTGQANFAKRQSLLDRAQLEAESAGLAEEALHVRNRKATSLIISGEKEAGIAELKMIREQASASGLLLAQARACNMLAYAYSKSSKPLEAREVFLEALEVEKQVEHVPLRIALLNNLLADELSLGDYKACQLHGKQALDLAAKVNDPVKAAFAHRELAVCYAFVGNYRDAEQHISKFLSISQATGNRSGVTSANLRWGWIELRRCKLEQAERLLSTARRLLAAEQRPVDIAHADLYLGMLASRRGELKLAEQLVNKALKVFRAHNESVPELDAEFELLLLAGAAGGKLDFDKVESLLQRSVALGYRFAVAKAAFSLLTEDAYFKQGADWELLKRARDHLEEDQGILAAATCTMFRFRQTATGDESGLDLLKQVFSALLRARYLPEAIPVAKLLSQRYLSLNPKLATAFLEKAAELYERLGNQAGSEELLRSIRTMQRRSSTDTGLLLALEELSSLLNSLTDYRHVLDRILATSLRLTGAERAVLLLADRVDGNLRVEAASEYDKQSLQDITAISNSVVRSVYDSHEPCLISDATQHERTKGFRSIMMHNILSVACIPLVLQGEPFGALYLDHHTLWGLFTPEDHRLMNVLGNFVAIAVGKARHLRNLELSVSQTRSRLEVHGIQMPIITEDPAMEKMLNMIPTIAQADTSVLITGESGTGKELLAEMIHRESSRSDGPLIMVNCATLDGSLVESELFGVAAGTATQSRAREGKFEAADGGTVFLDEIGELPLATQAMLLRVLEQKSFDRLGSNEPVNADFRLVAATNADLKERIAAGKFREDLYFRIQTVELDLPPLRERPEDIMLLIKHFLTVFNRSGLYRFPPETRRALHNYEWPGNVRQLKNVVERIILVVPPGDIRPEHLPPEIAKLKSGPYAAAMREKAEEIEKVMIYRALQEANWNQSKAARALGMPLSTLRRKMRKYGISKPPNRV